jgi:hypothetical protein
LTRDPETPDLNFVPLATGTKYNPPYPVEVYRDTATSVWLMGGNYTIYDNGYVNLAFKIANSSTAAIAVIGTTAEDSFETQISFKQAHDGRKITRQPLFAYPFDEVSISQ